jgi:hypothetical protein
MILWIDHVAVSSKDLEQSARMMELLGYETVFVEKEIENLKIKKGLLHTYLNLHDLAFFKSLGNMSIEVTAHGTVNSDVSNLLPIFENVPGHVAEVGEKNIVVNYQTLNSAMLKHFEAPILTCSNAYGHFKFDKIVVNVQDVAQSTRFWNVFGFETKIVTNRLAFLEFQSPVDRKTYRLILRKSKAEQVTHMLDDTGFTCIAFMSASAHKEKAFVDRKGFATTNIETLSVNGKQFNIFFTRGKSGELVEIIGYY